MPVLGVVSALAGAGLCLAVKGQTCTRFFRFHTPSRFAILGPTTGPEAPQSTIASTSIPAIKIGIVSKGSCRGVRPTILCEPPIRFPNPNPQILVAFVQRLVLVRRLAL